MKKYIFISALALIGFTYSCSDKKESTEETPVTENTIDNSSVAIDTTSGVQTPMAGEQPVMNAPTNGSVASPSNVATIPNPAHGEPKHRCEVPVGTPIPADGSAPAVSAQAQPQNIQMQNNAPQTMPISPAPSASPTPAPTTIMNAPAPASSTPVATAPGMNPPHGEPGHDCAIPVGSPLKK